MGSGGCSPVAPGPIRRVLIANRGEIARRIIRAAHEMGIATVAIYADGDARAPFVREADSALALRGRTAEQSYLHGEKILEAAGRAGADAIHPGYGFLSESENFATAVLEAGLRWVGPAPAVIAAVGDKLSAKRHMEKAGLPNLPSAELRAGVRAASAGREIGYPLLVKAAAGGGGRGMRIVSREADLEPAIEAARREAHAAFGNETLFLERWIEGARHVEIQILGDRHGHIVHCFERECSIQRRHQKLIEEAPSIAFDPELRERMGAAAVAAARAIRYDSAGTVEFLVRGREFWFLEMNTRLQVEHPVTEAITGVDLVREQLRIAQGEELRFSQADLTIDGHAIEARLYAEDPEREFLPVTGRVVAWMPSSSAPARFDAGIESGSNVGVEFDPLLAKVIVHAPTRGEAALRLAKVLETTRVQGLITNRDFLVATLRTPEFLCGDTTTDFIERVRPARRREISPVELADACIAAAMAAQSDGRARARVMASIPSGWRNSRMPPERVRLRHRDREVDVEYRARRDSSFWISVDQGEHCVRVLGRRSGAIELEIDGRYVGAAIERDRGGWLVHTSKGDVELDELPRFPVRDPEPVHGGLSAPMPGRVVAIFVKEGDHVRAGQQLLALEAMKIEHRIVAPLAGMVSELRVAANQQVAHGDILVVLSEEK